MCLILFDINKEDKDSRRDNKITFDRHLELENI